jgi:hypothetical protein
MVDLDHHLMNRAGEAADRLLSALRQVRHTESNRLGEPRGSGEWQPLPNPFVLDGTSTSNVGSARRIVDELAQILDKAGYQMRPPEPEYVYGETWSLGSITLATAPVRPIHLGYIEPALRIRVVEYVPDNVVAFLLEIPGGRDFLEREQHGPIGWHYHYLDSKRARSNIVLCWDTRVPHQKGTAHPLFQESHGEGHAEFTARPDLWGTTKKQSMHRVCTPDLGKWPLNTFRCASAKAQPVWPQNAKLTPIPSTNAGSTPFPAQSKRKRKH